MNALAVIPARAGSKGIPGKNVLPIGGKPLIAWTIEAAREAGVFEHLIVSSDSDNILAVAKTYGAEALKRPSDLAGDGVRSEPVLLHALQALKKRGIRAHFAAYLQPTSPLRTGAHIAAAFKHLDEQRGDALISVCNADKKYLKSYRVTDAGYLTGAVNDEYPNMNRQELPDIVLPNGAIYIVTVEDFLTHPRFFGKRTVPYLMRIAESIDLDDPADIPAIEAALRHRSA